MAGEVLRSILDFTGLEDAEIGSYEALYRCRVTARERIMELRHCPNDHSRITRRPGRLIAQGFDPGCEAVVKAAMVKVSTNGFIWISQSERVDD